MAAGLPLIAADNSAMDEVCGDGALLVNADDEDAIARALLSVLQSAETRHSLAARGREQAQRFTWRKAAEKTAIYLTESVMWQGRRRKSIPAPAAAAVI